MSNNSELDQFFTYVQKLEKRISKLESQKAIVIKTNPLNDQIKPLELPLKKLIDIYNDVPQVLVSSSKQVSLHPQSYREEDQNNLIVEQTIRGKYLVIPIQNNLNQKYYLLPHLPSQLKIHRLKSLELLFSIDGNIEQTSTTFKLIAPAELEILPDGKQWRITKRGQLSLDNDSPIIKVVSELEKILEQEKQVPESIEKLLITLQQINQGKTKLEQQIQLLNQRIEKLEPDYYQLINLYSLNPQEFSQLDDDTQKLKLSSSTENNILQNKSTDIYLETNQYGEYLRKKGENFHYLFPNPLEIFDHKTLTLAILSNLFITKSNIPVATLGSDIKIIKPAQIKLVDDSWESDLWELSNPGEISF